MRNYVSKKASAIQPSGIRKFFDMASSRKDVISLGVGEPDFITPWEIRNAGITAVKKGYTQYTSNKGLVELRQEISEYLLSRFGVQFDKDNIVITVGASEGIDITLRAIVDDGDEVLVPDPSYVSYKPCIELAGGKAVSVECSGENGFKLTSEAIESKITPNTKAIIFPYPNNPTGGVMEEEYIRKIIPTILKHDLLVIADEIYAELTYDQKHTSIASFSELKDRVVLISGFSKAFAMTGWRIGYVCAPTTVFNAILKIHQYTAICAPIFSQYAALEGLRKGKEDGYNSVCEMLEEYDRRRKYMISSLNKMGLTCFEPKGSFYVFPCVKSTGLDGQQFATMLLESQNVAVVPGEAFGEFGKDYIRCSYAYSMNSLTKAISKIEKFVSSLKN